MMRITSITLTLSVIIIIIIMYVGPLRTNTRKRAFSGLNSKDGYITMQIVRFDEGEKMQENANTDIVDNII